MLRRHLTLLWFLDFATVHSYFNIQMSSYSMLEIKSLVSLKNESFLFGWGYTASGVVGEVKFSKNLGAVDHKGGESDCLTDLEFFFEVGRGAR